MSTRRIAVVSAGLSSPSSTRMLADRLSSEVVRRLGARGIAVEVDAIELRDYAHDITDNLLTGFPSPALESAVNAIVSSDALIAVTPIFTTSYSGLFKSFLDVLDRDALTGTPVLIGATAGTPRHSLAIDYAIRPLFAFLHAAPVSTGVFATSSDWGGSGDEAVLLGDRIERGARELVEAILWRSGAALGAEEPPAASGAPEPGVGDPFDPATYLGEGRSFADLLGGRS